MSRPHKALRTRPRRRPRPRIRPRGVMEYWSVGVLRQVRIAPRGRGVGGAERAEDVWGGHFVHGLGSPSQNRSTAPSGRARF
jgi:hypothetical protein